MKMQAGDIMISEEWKHAKRVMVALDYPDAVAAERLLEQLTGTGCYLKVGMQLYYATGPQFVSELKQRGYRVFLDLKLHDIPNTVRGAAASITRLGVDMFNVHVAGGLNMMEQALIGVADASSKIKPLVIGVTQLTSTTQRVMNEQIGIHGDIVTCVSHYSELAKRAGLDGVVASPHEVKRIKQQCGNTFVTVTPGIRPLGALLDDQSRVMTPAQAFAEGTDFIVVGRPITASEKPREALKQIVQSIT
jgi:orotidine-5'-phosphate decarboxylase